jgi:hypothetical protein
VPRRTLRGQGVQNVDDRAGRYRLARAHPASKTVELARRLKLCLTGADNITIK